MHAELEHDTATEQAKEATELHELPNPVGFVTANQSIILPFFLFILKRFTKRVLQLHSVNEQTTNSWLEERLVNLANNCTLDTNFLHI